MARAHRGSVSSVPSARSVHAAHSKGAPAGRPLDRGGRRGRPCGGRGRSHGIGRQRAEPSRRMGSACCRPRAVRADRAGLALRPSGSGGLPHARGVQRRRRVGERADRLRHRRPPELRRRAACCRAVVGRRRSRRSDGHPPRRGEPGVLRPRDRARHSAGQRAHAEASSHPRARADARGAGPALRSRATRRCRVE